MKLHDDALRELGLAVIQVEAQAIADLAKQSTPILWRHVNSYSRVKVELLSPV